MKHVRPRRIVTPRIVQPGGANNLWLLVVGLLGLMLWTWQIFEAGRGWAGYSFENRRAQISTMQARIEELDAIVAQLRLEAASNARASQIDRDAVRQAQITLGELQTERASLRQEVSLLRGLLSAGRGALHVRDFHLTTQTEGRVRYRMTVAQALRSIGTTEGELRLRVDGKTKGGSKRNLDLADVSTDGQSTIAIRFVHYQDIDGELRLPEDFQPESVTIDIKPKNKGLKRVTRVFQWQLEDAH